MPLIDSGKSRRKQNAKAVVCFDTPGAMPTLAVGMWLAPGFCFDAMKWVRGRGVCGEKAAVYSAWPRKRGPWHPAHALPWERG